MSTMPPKSFTYHWRSYATLTRYFRNWRHIAWAHRYRQPLDRAVLWSGGEIVNVGSRGGFADTIVEIWGRQEYTLDFYTPADGDVVLDIGANLGLFSLWIAHAEPTIRLIAFEPDAENFAALRANLEPPPCIVELHQAAIGAEAGVGHMTDGGRSIDHQFVMGDGDTRVLTLNRAVAMAGGPVALLKMDIEGAEADAIAAASSDTLRQCARIVLEYHDHLRPGGRAVLERVLAQTHCVRVVDDGHPYGMLYATLRRQH